MREACPKPRGGLSREVFKSHHDVLLQPYSVAEADLLADLYNSRTFVLASDFPRYVKIMGNFYEAEPKAGWQEQAARILARAREAGL